MKIKKLYSYILKVCLTEILLIIVLIGCMNGTEDIKLTNSRSKNEFSNRKEIETSALKELISSQQGDSYTYSQRLLSDTIYMISPNSDDFGEMSDKIHQTIDDIGQELFRKAIENDFRKCIIYCQIVGQNDQFVSLSFSVKMSDQEEQESWDFRSLNVLKKGGVFTIQDVYDTDDPQFLETVMESGDTISLYEGNDKQEKAGRFCTEEELDSPRVYGGCLRDKTALIAVIGPVKNEAVRRAYQIPKDEVLLRVYQVPYEALEKWERKELKAKPFEVPAEKDDVENDAYGWNGGWQGTDRTVPVSTFTNGVPADYSYEMHTYELNNHDTSVTYPIFFGMKNQEVQEKINEAIKKQTFDFFESVLTVHGPLGTCRVECEVHGATADFVSVSMYYTRAAYFGRAQYYYRTFNYLLSDGTRFDFANVYNIGDNIAKEVIKPQYNLHHETQEDMEEHYRSFLYTGSLPSGPAYFTTDKVGFAIANGATSNPFFFEVNYEALREWEKS